jgi:hypothetical protein
LDLTPHLQGSILRNSVSDEKFSDNFFLSVKKRKKFVQKLKVNIYCTVGNGHKTCLDLMAI